MKCAVRKSICCCLLMVAATIDASAFPQFLDIFRADPFRRPEVDGCATCHVNPAGGGPRNEFGQAFDANERQVTPLLRARFSDRFVFPSTAAPDGTAFHFSDPNDASLVVELDGETYLVDLGSRSVEGLAAVPSESPGQAPVAAGAGTIRPVDPETSVGAFFGSRIVSLSSAKALERGAVEFLVGHRFTAPVFDRNSPASLFGFDSSALVTFGAKVGLTNRLAVEATRSNDRAVELSSALQLSGENSGAPLSSQVRIGIEGANNFRDRFVPFVQVVGTKSIGDRFSVSLAPTVAFNTRREDLPEQFLDGSEFDYTIGLGVGAGLRILPTLSLVGEYAARLKGFKGIEFDPTRKPVSSISFGIQKATFRHTFEFVVSTTPWITTTGYLLRSSRDFRVGFNIYRRLR